MNRMILWSTTALVITAIGLLTFVLVIGIADGRTITVDDDGGADHTKIQYAVENSTEGDIIQVSEGTYFETIIIDKTIELRGSGSEGTIIDGEKKGHVVNITADNVMLSGFTIQRSGGYDRGGVITNSDHNNISNCDFTDNKYGIILQSDNNEVYNCRMLSNTYASILILDGLHNTITQCNFSRELQLNGGHYTLVNGCYFPYGMMDIERSDNVVVENCLFLTESNSGINLDHSRYSTIRGNTLWKERFYIEGDQPSHFLHTFQDNTAGGKPLLYVRNGTGSVISGSDHGQIILANCDNIELKDIDMADGYVGIEMGFCTNSDLTNITLTDFGDGLFLVGTTDTTISDSTFTENYHGLYFVRSSQNRIEDCTFTAHYDYAVKLDEGSSGNTITQCTFSANNAGIRIIDGSNNNVIANTTVTNTESTGAIELDHSTGTMVIDCTFTIMDDSGVYAEYDSHDTTIINCTISLSEGPGIYIDESDNVTVLDCTIINCENIGIEIYLGDNCIIRDCNLTGNEYEGIMMDDSNNDTSRKN